MDSFLERLVYRAMEKEKKCKGYKDLCKSHEMVGHQDRMTILFNLMFIGDGRFGSRVVLSILILFLRWQTRQIRSQFSSF